ncbi:unnamed protein product [Somion occarium]|uniref:Uncharacterized protein n=1 Tax=Somion occarium TaxID=3059160 RepID=A0ABP1CP50_9APHY
MTAPNVQPDLPQIPSLPPLEMPTHSFLSSDAETSQDPESMLVNTVPPSDSSTLDRGSPTPSLLAPPTSLRKSISVDSFIKQKHIPTRPARSIRVNAPGPYLLPTSEGAARDASPSGQDYYASGPSVSHRQEHEHQPSRRTVSTHNRGTVISTSLNEPYTPSYENSDGERSEELRRHAGKGKSVSRQAVPEGELTLPSRLPSSSPISTKAPDPIVPERSSSLLNKLSKPRSLMSVNTHLLPPKYSHHRPEVAIAVIGTRGCGKSTVIRKGLKAYGLSDPSVLTIQQESAGLIDDLQYTLRVGRIPHGGNSPDSVLRVMEIDIAPSDDVENKLARLCSAALSVNGTVFCFDSSDLGSFSRVEPVIRSLDYLKLPSIVLACKSDMDRRVDLNEATSVLHQLDVGLVEATTTHDAGKMRIRDTFELILKLASKATERSTPRNPASPAIVSAAGTAPWDISRADSATPTAATSHSAMQSAQAASPSYTQAQPRGSSPRIPQTHDTLPHSPPARARSMGDLLTEQDLIRKDSREQRETDWERNPSPGNGENSFNGGKEEPPQPSAAVRAPPWVTLDDLLDKLLFVAVSDDDPVFVNHFFLTYRRFATPRSILLAMQKRMRTLDQPTGDPMFACFAQMKICCLLDCWMRTYATDFAVPGTAGAFSALIKSILGKTYLLHYGSEFIPFMEILPTLKDKDAFWAVKVEAPAEDSDEESIIAEPALRSPEESSLSSVSSHSFQHPEPDRVVSQPLLTRERKSSLPLARFTTRDKSHGHSNGGPKSRPSPKAILNKLSDIASRIDRIDPSEIAQEISRVECEYFLQIEPRHWLQHVFSHGKEKNEIRSDSITRFNVLSNHIGSWVQSMILSHDKPKARARQIEKFADVANRLRIENNYSGLRAVVAGVNGATFDGDMSVDIYRAKNPSSWKTFQSFDQLLQSVRSHQKYRMALRNTKGACIPALEIHLSDLIRAHEGNCDFHDDDPAKIHWAKFNMMGRFIDTIAQCQRACRESGAYQYAKRHDLYDAMLIDNPELLMTDESQRHPLSDPEANNYEPRGVELPRTMTREDTPHPAAKDGAPILKKIFFW